MLSTFAALAFVSVGQVRSVAQDLSRIKDELLELARTSAQLETHQQNRFRDLRRALEAEDGAARAVILRVGLAYYPEVVDSAIRDIERAAPTSGPNDDAEFWTTLRERAGTLRGLHAEVDRVTGELLAPSEDEIESLRDRVPELEVALRSETYRLTKAINDQLERVVHRAVRQERVAVWRISGVTLAALVLGLVIMGLAGRALAPIGRLVDYARALSRGDYDRPLGVERTGELGRLAEELELMARARKERELELGRQADELERAYRRVEELKRYHESIVRSLRTGVVVLDPEQRIASTNRAAMTVWGMDAEQLRGAPFSSTPVGEALRATAPDRDLLDAPRTFTAVAVGERLADVTTAPLEDESGARLGSIVSLEDVTETVRTKEALIRSERLAAIGRMSAHVTHEVRNPLSSIGLNAEMLEDWVRRHADSEQASQLCRAIGQEIDRLTELTDEYLRFARLPRPEVEPVEVGAFLGGLAAFLRPDFAAAGIDVKLAVAPGAEEVWADSDQLRQAILNLARNAKEAMPRGGTLTLGAEPRDLGIALTVRDDGVGISSEDQGRIFDPFYSTKLTGTGLGLALTQQIVQEHGGFLDVDSTLGQGTEFVLTLPRPPRAATPGAEPTAAAGPAPSGAEIRRY